MHPALKWVGLGLAAVVALAVLVALSGYIALRNSVASPSGTLAMAGLSAPVEVVRDKEGVPHIFAKSEEDLYSALGFVHAQDRLWQMELTRRTGQGRLSEIFGERTFTTDVFLRTLDAYTRGVNAFLNRRIGWFERGVISHLLSAYSDAQTQRRPRTCRALSVESAVSNYLATIGRSFRDLTRARRSFGRARRPLRGQEISLLRACGAQPSCRNRSAPRPRG